MKDKLYFPPWEGGMYCYRKESILRMMKERDLEELEVQEGKRGKFEEGMFFCKEDGEVYENVSYCGHRPCGKECSNYSPRNDKNGICKHHSKVCYYPWKKVTFKLNEANSKSITNKTV
jgi:nitrite reductase/ring-hydroxylating ferredoxin subunit